ncbi:hypothetical protein INS49_015485 [Diaporthe citri]|uniref:uncharacterized protein n=1 Tax=Diaporthe citri TaxID=83186 RepID=UPI001C7EB7BC|nr:uncharacterized protein INS49_015485 [Diaporthe citri]KAG6356100.1 hypothetical protein INS49_015485 [Diaporthe citri]
MAHLSRHDPLSIHIELQDELGRFNLWAGNIGVFAPLQASLDFRLIDVPDIRAQFLRQLDTLSITLTQLNEAAVQASTDENEDSHDENATREADGSLVSEHDIFDLVQSIHVTIDWLHRLSNLVRKASFGSQNQRAARFPLEDEAGNDITECLAEMFKHLIKRECCDISDQILNRLAQTMIIRRRRVLYRRSRQKRWVLQQEAYRPRHLDPPAQLAPLQEEEYSGEDHERSEVTEEVEFEPENRVKVAPSGMTVTTLDQQKYRKLAAPSRISRATTAPLQHDEKLLVPPRPHLAKYGKEFVCDYCCLILPSSEAADQDTWANHVKKDLDPYICVFDDCTQPYQIFSSSKEWLAHMRSEHRMSWRCVVRDHPPQIFETPEAFLNHMTDAHPGKFRKDQLPFIAESSARALSPTVPACPFCDEDSGDLENHVGKHLCHFALQSLPWPDHLYQHSEIMSEPEMNSSSSEDVERETIKDDLDDSLGFIDVEWIHSLDTEPEPLLDMPVSWPIIQKTFPEPDQVLSELAAHVARRATIGAKDIHGKPETLDEELFQVREQLPNVVLIGADTDTRAFSTAVSGALTTYAESQRPKPIGPRLGRRPKLGPGPFPEKEWLSAYLGHSQSHSEGHSQDRMLRASLRGPWGFEGEHIVLNVEVAVPDAYPEAQAPSFTIEEDEHMPERIQACLGAVFSYLLGERDLTSIIDMFKNERGHAIPVGDVDEDKPPASPISQTDGLKFAKVAHKHGSTEPKTEAQPKSGYLAKRGKNFGAWKSRFYVVEGPQLEYYDAAGGAQLGSINLQGAQIGRQQPRVDTQYRHSLLILEPKKGSSTIRHVLCAESDEERDLWLEALLPWTNHTDSGEMPSSEHDPSGASESQTAIPQLHTFLIQENGKSVNMGNEHPYRRLDELARTLPEAMYRANELELHLMIPEAHSVQPSGMPSGHGLDRYVDTQENIDPSSGGALRHAFDGTSHESQPRESVNVDDTENIGPSSSVQYTPPPEDADLVDQSAGPSSNAKDSQQHGHSVDRDSFTALPVGGGTLRKGSKKKGKDKHSQSRSEVLSVLSVIATMQVTH